MAVTTAPSTGAMPQGAPPQGMPAGGPPNGGPGAGPLGFVGPGSELVILAVLAVTLVVLAIAFYFLFKRAGRPGLLGLLMVIPIVNLGVALWLAFGRWPLEEQNRQMKAWIAQNYVAPAEDGATDAASLSRESVGFDGPSAPPAADAGVAGV